MTMIFQPKNLSNNIAIREKNGTTDLNSYISTQITVTKGPSTIKIENKDLSKDINAILSTPVTKETNFMEKEKKDGCNENGPIKNELNELKLQIEEEFYRNKMAYENFELLEYIGKGKDTYVYKSMVKKTKKNVAMKIISIKENKKNTNEVNIHSKLKHINIIDFYANFEIKKNELDCIIIDYCKLGNLIEFQNNLIKKNYLSETMLCFFVYQILDGLNYLHRNKIGHLDLKPQNIVVDEYLVIKIIDFTISLNYSKIKSTKIKLPRMGTSFFMAPEVLNSDIINVKDINKVDLYSLGVIIYFLAFGYFPFDLDKDDIKDYTKIYQKIKNELKIDNEDNYYSPYFIDFIQKLLENDINKRIDINQALNHYWVKGAQILLDEKEKNFNASQFLSYLVADHIKNFDDYIKRQK